MYLEDSEGDKEEYGREDDLNDRNNEASMNHKLCEFSTSLVAVPSVPQQQSTQVTKLRERKIRGKGRLSPFLSLQANTYILQIDTTDHIP